MKRLTIATLFALLCASAFYGQQTGYRVVVVEAQGGRVSTFDSGSGKRIGSVPVGSKPHELEISPDGRTAYVTNFGIEDYDHRIGTPGNSISVIDLVTAREKYRLSTENLTAKTGKAFSGKAPHGVKLRPNAGNELFVNTEDGGDLMLVYDTRSRTLKRAFGVPAGTHNFIFSRNGRSLYVFAGAAGVFKLDPKDGRVLASAKLSTPVRGLHYSADGRSIIAAGRGEIAFLNPKDLSVARTYGNLGGSQILYPKPTPDGRFVLLPIPEDSTLAVLDLETGKINKRLKVGSAPIAVAISPDGANAFVSSDTDKSFVIVDLSTFEFKTFAEADGSNGIGISRAKIH